MSSKGAKILFSRSIRPRSALRPLHKFTYPERPSSFIRTTRSFSNSTHKMPGLETVLTKDACPRKLLPLRVPPPHQSSIPSYNFFLTSSVSCRPIQPSNQSRRSSLGRGSNSSKRIRRVNRRLHRREDSPVLQEPQGYP